MSLLSLRLTTAAFVAMAWTLPASAAPSTGYICIADSAVGFGFEGKGWRPTTFSADERFILKPLSVADREQLGSAEGAWGYFDYARPASPLAECKLNSDKAKPGAGSISCSGTYEIRFNIESLRFLWIYSNGYTDGKDNNDNTPAMMIGKCSPF